MEKLIISIYVTLVIFSAALAAAGAQKAEKNKKWEIVIIPCLMFLAFGGGLLRILNILP